MKRLYEIPENQNVKLYIEDKVVIFGHLDGLYSYCWLEEDKSKIVHINANALFEKYKDGYKYIESKGKGNEDAKRRKTYTNTTRRV